MNPKKQESQDKNKSKKEFTTTKTMPNPKFFLFFSSYA